MEDDVRSRLTTRPQFLLVMPALAHYPAARDSPSCEQA